MPDGHGREFEPQGPVLVHTDALKTSGLVPRGGDLGAYLELHVAFIRQLAHGSAVWMPSFNYDFFNTRIFRPRSDKCQVGAINESFRQGATWRTEVPVFSVAGDGDSPLPAIVENSAVDPFGIDSIFGSLIQRNGAILWYGAPIASSTILHHAESLSGGPLYRYDKTFSGLVTDLVTSKYVNLHYHVRPLGHHLAYDWARITVDAENAGVIRPVETLAGKNVYFAHARDLMDLWTDALAQDPLYMLDRKSIAWVRPMLENLGRRFELQDFEETARG